MKVNITYLRQNGDHQTGHTLSPYLSEYWDALKALALSIHRAETFVVFSELAANQLVHQWHKLSESCSKSHLSCSTSQAKPSCLMWSHTAVKHPRTHLWCDVFMAFVFHGNCCEDSTAHLSMCVTNCTLLLHVSTQWFTTRDSELVYWVNSW